MPNSLATRTAPGISDNQQRRARRQLTEERAFRSEQLVGLQVDVAADPSLRTDAVWCALGRAAGSALTAAEGALRRLDTARFGRCERCDGSIPAERLEVLPMAALCMGCQCAQELRR